MTYTLQNCIDECMRCIASCSHCANACLERGGMDTCIARCLECSELCETFIKFATTSSPHLHIIARACAELCEACADTCSQHEDEHCQVNAEACRLCAEMCRVFSHHPDTIAYEQQAVYSFPVANAA